MIEAPGPETQLAFLQKLQRVYEEGDFTATYKYALLMALAELAVERGADDGASLTLKMTWIAEKFVELYWPQTTPYAAGVQGTQGGVLAQNLGRQATVVGRLVEFRRLHSGSLAQARSLRGWDNLLAKIESTVRDQPVNFLQNVRGQPIKFLYEVGPGRGEITLLPGVAFCLRRFQALVHQLSRAGWVRHVRENTRNRPIVGEAGDLEAFMFGQRRANLQPVRDVLCELQSGRCFYCQRELRANAVVDHFIPWARYSRDLAHNFVLADSACNSSKSDMLAAKRHLERWCELTAGPRARETGRALAESGFIADLDCSRTVARWAYGQGMATGAIAWVRRDSIEAIDAGYLELLRS